MATVTLEPTVNTLEIDPYTSKTQLEIAPVPKRRRILSQKRTGFKLDQIVQPPFNLESERIEANKEALSRIKGWIEHSEVKTWSLMEIIDSEVIKNIIAKRAKAYSEAKIKSVSDEKGDLWEPFSSTFVLLGVKNNEWYFSKSIRMTRRNNAIGIYSRLGLSPRELKEMSDQEYSKLKEPIKFYRDENLGVLPSELSLISSREELERYRLAIKDHSDADKLKFSTLTEQQKENVRLYLKKSYKDSQNEVGGLFGTDNGTSSVILITGIGQLVIDQKESQHTIITVHPDHKSSYLKFLPFQQLTPEYYDHCGRPAVTLGINRYHIQKIRIDLNNITQGRVRLDNISCQLKESLSKLKKDSSVPVYAA